MFLVVVAVVLFICFFSFFQFYLPVSHAMTKFKRDWPV